MTKPKMKVRVKAKNVEVVLAECADVMAKKTRKKKKVKILLDRVQLIVADACADDDKRYALSNLCVEPDGTVAATDGRALLTVGPNPIPAKEWPAGAAQPVSIEDHVLVPSSMCAAARKRIGNNTKRIPILNSAALSAADDKSVELTTTTLAKTMRESERAVDGSFPDWQDMIPDDDGEGITIGMDAKRLASLLKTLAAMKTAADTAGECNHVEITIRDGDKPIVLTADVGPNRKAVAVIEQVRGKVAK